MRPIFVFLFLLPSVINGQLRLAWIFSDNMVIQREQPINIWGKGIPGKNVRIGFADKIVFAKVKADSTWNTQVSSQKANRFPQTLRVESAGQRVIVNNILIGDVWVCIGQSNMEWPMMKEMHFKEEIFCSLQPLLRLFNPTYAGKNIFGTAFTDSVINRLDAERFYEGQWSQCDSNTFKTMSAVAYYFGKDVANSMQVPVGLINLSIGGAPLETFVDKTTLAGSKKFSYKVKDGWMENEALPFWIRERANQNVGSSKNVLADNVGKNHAFKPGFAYSAGIDPITQMPVKGILCYQGESNAQETERVFEYAELSKLMIDDYRKKWKQSGLPFYYVQLSSIDTIKYKGQLWPEFRNEQRTMMNIIEHCGMAVSSDIGVRDDVHPTNKKEVAARLVRWALYQTYKQDIVPSGPLPMDAKYESGKVVITFQHLAKGLKTMNGGKVKGFSLDGKNESDAIIREDGILIFTAQKPEFVYYGWSPFSNGNLVNSEDLPASTFKLKVK